jgi:hypothetical protein
MLLAGKFKQRKGEHYYKIKNVQGDIEQMKNKQRAKRN